MARMIVAITQTKLDAKKKIILVQLVSLLATTVSALIIIWYATKWLIVQMNLTSHYIVMLMNAPKLKFTNADINVSIL